MKELIQQIEGLHLTETHIGPLFNAGWEECLRNVLRILRRDGASLIKAERDRQILDEKWTPEHDDLHPEGDLAHAAMAYLLQVINSQAGDHCPACWPWDKHWWKPSTPVRNLVKSGALIAAEIDRLERKAALDPTGKSGVGA